MAAEIGGPEWNLGYADYGFAGDGTIIAAARSGGRDRLCRIDPAGRADPDEIPLPFTELDYVGVRGDRLVCLAASPTTFRSVVVLVNLLDGSVEVLRRASEAVLDPGRSRACRAGRLPDDRRAHRARHPVPAAQPGRPGARRRAAAAHGHEPRRPDGRGARRAHGLDPGPRHARDRGPRRGLRGQHGLRPRVPQAAHGQLGRRGRRRLRGRRPGAGGSRDRGSGARSRSRAAPHPGSRRSRRSPSGMSSGPA